jgi:RNA polymerase sigma-70 factor (ECF subfamily)
MRCCERRPEGLKKNFNVMKIFFLGNKTAATPVSEGMVSKQQRFDALVNALYADIYRYALWLTKNKAVSEDLVQDTYLRAWRSFESLKDEKAAKAWLITILRRENARRFERYQPDMVDVDDVSVADLGAGPGQSLENHMLQKAIAALDIEFREPLMLQVMGGFSAEEISAILDVNKNTVLTRLFRARNKLKDALSDNQDVRGHRNG